MIEKVTMTRWKAEALITMLDGSQSVMHLVSLSCEKLKESKTEIIKEYSLRASRIKFMGTRKEVVYDVKELTIDEEVIL